ncbi:MAG: ATP-binding protein [Candidatus Omnitrophota bacterium]
MIRMEEITIKEFRGIRDLNLQFKGQNFAVCGPNGTGKSGVVDAVEFALTGNISRLVGEGTKGVSVKDHAPHVDSRDNPEKAEVTVKIFIPSLKKSAAIHRTVKEAKNPKITPDSSDIKAVLDRVALHPEFVLSRREIIRYVLAEPGKRSKEVQALLRLDELEAMRAVLQKIVNATKRELSPLTNAKNSAGEELKRAMEITRVVPMEILNAANQRRAILSLSPISALNPDTSLKDGLTAVGTGTSTKIQKGIALNDMEAAKSHLQSLKGESFQKECVDVHDAIVALEAEAPDNTSQEDMLQTALRLFDEEHCPVCDTRWEPEEFKKCVNGKLKNLEEIKQKREMIQGRLESLCKIAEDFTSSIRVVYSYGGKLKPPIHPENIASYGQLVVGAVTQLRKYTPIGDSLTALETFKSVPDNVTDELDQIADGINKIPEASQQDAARDYLVIAQERLEAYRTASLSWKKGEDQARMAAEVYEIYISETTAALEKIYKKVEKTFTDLYRRINDDEEGFNAQLIPSAGKLGFDVDFYGRGFFPPGAYHSEGHQDSMGLCLYLALMNHLLGKDFIFSVLDDVLMSVDSGHRREVTKMLMEEFSNTQFIMTTHDDVWLNHMKSAGLVKPKRYAHFCKWSVELGPTEWNDRDVWQEIKEDLSKNDVRAAAALLRHYLEHLTQEICNGLRARVEFRDDGQFELGDLLPSAIGTLRKRLKAGKATAQSWGDSEAQNNLGKYEQRLTMAVTASQVDQWQMNAAIHYNTWARLEQKDFEPVVETFKALVDCFKCEVCHGFLYILPDKGNPEALRCGCSKTNINLVEKPK